MSTEPTPPEVLPAADSDPWFDSTADPAGELAGDLAADLAEDLADDGFGDLSGDLSGDPESRPTTEALVELLGAVWGSFVDDETPLEPALTGPPAEVVAGEVSINGSWTGRLLVSIDLEGARHVAARMFVMPVEDVQQDDLYDTVGEVANMIGGNVKSMLDGDCQLGLPVVHPPDSSPLWRSGAAPLAAAELSWGGRWLAVSLESTSQEES